MTMLVKLQDIKEAFSDLESGMRSREEIAEFAGEAMRAEDSGLLRMEPTDEASLTWRAIVYLSGVDIKECPETYLHCVEDFVEFRMSMGLSNLER